MQWLRLCDSTVGVTNLTLAQVTKIPHTTGAAKKKKKFNLQNKENNKDQMDFRHRTTDHPEQQWLIAMKQVNERWDFPSLLPGASVNAVGQRRTPNGAQRIPRGERWAGAVENLGSPRQLEFTGQSAAEERTAQKVPHRISRGLLSSL